MNPRFDPRNKPMQPSSPFSPEPMSSQGQSESNVQRDSIYEAPKDRFEMLSAYLDGEVTATERRQVEEWLTHDPAVRQLHARLLKLRQAFRVMPVPTPSEPIEETIDHVLAKIDRRSKFSLIQGGAGGRFAVPIGIAALFVGAVTVFGLYRPQSPDIPQPVAVQKAEPSETGGLMVALDQPVITMPKDATSEMKAPANKGFDKNHDAH